jgi:hypothetical protein
MSGPIIGLLALGAVAAGCAAQGSSTGSTTSRPRSAPVTTVATVPIAQVPSSTTATEQSTTSSSTTPAPAADLASAKQEWIHGSSVESAELNPYLLRAASDLSSAITARGINASQYQTAVGQLNQLASLPETSDTPAQMMEAHTDVAALDTFFDTPGLYN